MNLNYLSFSKMMISIEIPVTHGKYLRQVLESIRNQSYQDYEVIVVSSGRKELSDIVKEFGFKVIEKEAKLLHARYIAHMESKGEYTLILDETRMLEKDTLKTLSSLDYDMIIIGEKEIGESFWVKLAQLDKDNILYCNPIDPLNGIALPRYFKSEILSKAFSSAKEKLGEKFYEVVFWDHAIIFYEASKISNKIYVINDPLISHFGDSSLLDIVRKYYRYGKTAKVLKNTHYSDFLARKRVGRRICKGSFWERRSLYLLYLARGIPYLLGYYLG